MSAGTPTATDILFVMNRQKARILERTQRGVDINGQEFAPYNTTRPYYYYPNKSSTAKGGRSRSATRFTRKLGIDAKIDYGIYKTKIGVRFNSYAAFKSALGRTCVDLLGPSAPHMLQAMVAKAVNATEGILGIYGEEADRATGHNTGAGHLPKREFFGWGDKDEAEAISDLDRIIGARLNKLF